MAVRKAEKLIKQIFQWRWRESFWQGILSRDPKLVKVWRRQKRRAHKAL